MIRSTPVDQSAMSIENPRRDVIREEVMIRWIVLILLKESFAYGRLYSESVFGESN